MPNAVDRPKEHHVWCNLWTIPIEECHPCRILWKKDPYKPGEEANLLTMYFPQRRTLTPD